MNVVKSGFYAAALAAVSQSVIAAPFAHEARSLGMGNVGVATADIATAPFANPAMLSFQKAEDDFSLLLSVGGFVSDNEGMIDDIDDFQAATTDTEKLALVQQMEGKILAPELSGAIAIGFTTEKYSMAISVRSDVVLTGDLSNVSADETTVNDPAFNILTVAGAKTTEVGFSIARSFEIMDRKMSIGLMPKIVSVEGVLYQESVVTADTDLNDLVDNAIEDLGDFTSLDVGVVMGLTDNIQLGVTAKNLISEEISFGTKTLSFDTELKVGVAYNGDILTVGADLDLTENDSMLSGGMKRQNLSVGLELDAFDFAQLRVGMMKNIANGISSEDKKAIYTAGVGLWLGFNLDVAVMSGAGDSLGAFVQTGFKF